MLTPPAHVHHLVLYMVYKKWHMHPRSELSCEHWAWQSMLNWASVVGNQASSPDDLICSFGLRDAAVTSRTVIEEYNDIVSCHHQTTGET